MTSLAALEGRFQDFLRGRSDTVLDDIAPGGELAAAARLGIYRHAYRQRLVEALGNEFPGLLALLGTADFADLAYRYVAAHPSRNPSLRWLGAALPNFLETAIPGATGNCKPPTLAADMAHFDWAVAHAFDAPDAAPLSLADMLSLPPAAWDSVSFTFTPSLSEVEGDDVLGDLRQALLRDIRPLPTPSGRRLAWLVWRLDGEVQFRATSAEESASLRIIRDGGSFGAMCGLLAEGGICADPVLRAAELIKDWFDRGLVIGLVHDAALSN